MKKVISLLLALFCVGSLFAAQGELWGEKDLKQVSTEWFDIIYPQACEESAQILYQNADSIYETLSEMYNCPIPCRMTVTLTTAVEMYNAYWSNGYYNRIVLYVAPPIDECNVESDNLLKTFHHELTHAFTYNMKIPYWKWVGKVFGDAIYPGYLNITSGMAEGATVSSESYDGEGRLNDEFAKQYVKQAKIENSFPKFNEVQGSRDIYPSGTFYFFNGAFHEWLQKKYGFEPYREWWFNCVNAKALTIRTAFKKAYGTKLIDEWEQFVQEYPVPEIPANPVEAGLVQDFYKKENTEYSIYNAQGALPVSLSYSQKGLTYIDSKTNTVYFVPAEKIRDDTVKPKKLFTENVIQSAKQSSDGKLIAVTYYALNYGTYRYCTKIYNTEAKNWYLIKETGIQDSSIIYKDGKYYLVALKFHGEEYKIRISELEFKNKKIVSEKEPVFIPYSRVELPAGFTDLNNGTFAYTVKDVMDYYICVADLNGQIQSEISVPYERMVVRYPSYSQADNSLYFSWTIPGSMPRLGKLDFNTNSFILDEQDLSGGIYYPVKYDDKIIYSGQFYTSNRIFYKNDVAENSLIFEETADFEEDTEEDLVEAVENLPEYGVAAGKNINDDAKKYNQLKFLTKGILAPFSTVSSYAYGENVAGYSLPIGFSYFTSDPWGGNNYQLSAGYGYKTNSVGFSASYQSGTGSSLLNYQVFSSTELDLYGWKQSEVDLSVSSVFPVGHYSSFSIVPSATGFIGRYSASDQEASYRTNRLASTKSKVLRILNQRIGEYESVNLTNNLYTNDSVTFSFSSVHKGYDNDYSRTGVQFGFAPYYMYNGTLDHTRTFANTFDIAIFGRCYIPALIPICCKENFTYNLPSKIAFGLFGAGPMISSSTYSYVSLPALAFVTGETILFATEIQKVSKYLPFVYFSDFRISLCGTYGMNYSNNTYADNLRILKLNKYIEEIKNSELSPYGSASLKFTLDANPVNFGQFANSNFMFSFYGSANIVFAKATLAPFVSWGLDASF